MAAQTVPSTRGHRRGGASPAKPGGPALPIKMLNDRMLVQIPTAKASGGRRGGILIPATAQV